MASEAPAEFLGRAVAAARSELGLKRMQLKERSGLSYPYIAEIENGGKYPSQRAIAALAAALETTPSELLGRAERLAGSGGAAGESGAGAPSSEVVKALNRGDSSPARDTLRLAGEDQLVARLTEQIVRAVEPRIRDWLHMEIRMAVQDELNRQREGR